MVELMTEAYKKITPITEEALEEMPRKMSKRLRPALQPGVEEEFYEFIEDMGYGAWLASPMVSQLLFETFIGGWGSKTRQLKKRKAQKHAEHS